MCSSEWQSPAYRNRIRTSCALGGSSSMSTTSQSWPTPRMIAAFVFMAPSVLVCDDAAQVLAVEQVLVPLVDLVQRVVPGDELVQLVFARLVEVEHLADVVDRVAAPEEQPVDRLLEQRQVRAGDLNRLLLGVCERGDDDPAPLP